MSNLIKLKNGSGSDPQASDLVVGEVALRTDSGQLFTKKDDGNIAEIGAAAGVSDGDKGDIIVSNTGDTFTIDNGVINNAKVASDAAIAGSKISPNFTSAMDVDGSITCNDIITAGALLHEGDTDTLVHFSAANTIEFKTGGSTRMTANNSGVLLNSTLNVNGNRIIIGDSSGSSVNRLVLGNNDDLSIYHDSSNSFIQNATGNLVIETPILHVKATGNPTLLLEDTDQSNQVGVRYKTTTLDWIAGLHGGINQWKISKHTSFGTNDYFILDASGNLAITNNITLGGTVDGVDIAARDTLFGGLTSSSGVLTNGVTATTQAQSDNSTKVSTTAYVRTAVSNLVNSAPSTLDTLKELSDALGADANFSTTVTNSIATKLPLAGGTLTGNLAINTGNSTNDLSATNIFRIMGNDVRITNAAGSEALAVLQADGAVSLYHGMGSGTTAEAKLATTSTGVSVTGAIAVSGTVDGRDVAADGTKLDGIESDYVKEIRTQNDLTTRFDSGFYETSTATTGEGWPQTTDSWYHLIASTHSNATNYYSMQIAGNFFAQKFYIRNTQNSGTKAWSEIWTSSTDGSGSGLDADTVDGIQGASLLRSDANDTYTGTLSLAGHIVDSGDSRSVKLMGGTTDSQPFLGIGEQSLYGMKIRWDSSQSIQFDGFWNTSVDGTPNKTLGSININTSTWNIPAATFSNGINVGDLSNGGITGNNYNITGVNSLAFNDPGEGLIFKDGLTLILIDDANDNICNFDGAAELRVNGSKVWTASNDGSGSGLDADKVDGVEASSFLRSDADDVASHRIRFENNATDNEDDMATSTGSLGCIEIKNMGAGNDAFMAFHGGQDFAFYLGLNADINDLAVGGWSMGANKYRVWHAGNDGANSGLDSDKLDGQDGSYYRNAGNINAGTLNAARLPNHSAALLTSGTIPAARLPNHSAALLTSGTIPDARISSNFMKSNATSNANLNTAQSAGVYRLNTGITNGTSGINSYGTLLNCNNGSDTGFQIYANYNSDNYFIRGGNSSTFGGSGSNRAWAKIWNDQNDGSGSNLDADKVDGLQASQFVRSDANDTMTGTLTIGDGSAQTELHIKKADNNVSDHLQFYNGTTRMGEIGCEDGTWLRINQETNKNIYTPRLIRADGGFQVDGITVIDGSANIIGSRVSGTVASATNADTVDNLQASSFIRSDANDNVSGHTEWQDSSEVRLGAGADMRLYHNGSQSYIDNHTSHLYIRNAGGNDNANIYIQARDGENSIICEDDADVRLFSDNTEVFRTDTTNSCKVKHLYPWTNNAYNLGSTSLRWKNLYVQDMHFHNGEENPNKVDGTWGDWTLQEGENDIFMINNRSGKKFKIAMIPV